jgi:hypothetical protein
MTNLERLGKLVDTTYIVSYLWYVIMRVLQTRVYCTVICGPASSPHKLTASNGTITSPNYPNNYAHLTDCHWLIVSSAPNEVSTDQTQENDMYS